ncbi:hypothetical protein PTKIN_Ptkin18bG0114500 [Pterospermum kingtungense]
MDSDSEPPWMLTLLQKMASDLEPWMLELLKNIEVEDKGKLEETYGVEFDPDCLHLSCLLITSFSDDFNEASNCDKEQLLKERLVKMLDEACWRVTCNLRKDVDEDGSDIEYLLRRACVELFEIRKEKECMDSELWVPCVRKEYAGLVDTWHTFEEKCKPLVLSQFQTRAEELGMLKEVHEELVSYLKDEKAIKEVEASTRMFQKLNDLRAKIELSINKELKQILIVRKNDIVEAAGRILSIPAPLPSNFFEPNYQDLDTRLAKRLFGQEHAISAITSALSGPYSGKGPIRSFIFINGSICGGEELTKALAEQLFYDEERVIEFNLAKKRVIHLNFRQINIGLPECIELSEAEKAEICGFRGELFDAVKKMPNSVILLRNINEAHAAVIDFLLEILRNGKIMDENGKLVDFTKTLIIMTANVFGNFDMRRRWKCNCAFMTEKLFLRDRMDDHDCCYLSLLKDAKQHFKPELLDIIDNMIVFKILKHSEFKACLRLQIRKLASSIGGGRIIVYPSEAALDRIAPLIESYYEDQMAYFEKTVVPKLLEIFNHSRRGRSILYIDTLVGTDDLSYRVVEMDGCLSLTRDREFGQFLVHLCEFWNIYMREISWLRNINGLRETLQFIYQTENSVDPLPLGLLAYKFRKILTSESSVNSIPSNLPIVNNFRSDQLKKRAKEIEDFRERLSNRLVSNHYVFTAVAKAILESTTRFIPNDSHPLTALLLCLASDGKANLRRDLTELLEDEDNGMKKMLFQINLSQCSNYDEFFKLIYAGHNQSSLDDPEIVGMRPGSVLLIDQVEKASMSVFSGLIALLDYRILTDCNQACTIDLSDTIIIMVSDLANRDFVVELFKASYERRTGFDAFYNRQQPESRVPGSSNKLEKGLFRSELLNRVDELVFFNPSFSDQLTNFARFSMRDAPHLKHTRPTLLRCALENLFDESNFELEPGSKVMDGSVEYFIRGFIREDSGMTQPDWRHRFWHNGFWYSSDLNAWQHYR